MILLRFPLLFGCIFLFLNVFSQDNEVCIVDAAMVPTPGSSGSDPTTGYPTFPDGTAIQFCYTVEEYNSSGTQNWIHGIVPIFGPGWDLSTLQPIGQPETQCAGCSSNGEWIWTDMVTAGQTGELIAESGWWFDASSGSGSLNGDPSDNWGDGNNGPWEFCFQISTKTCPPSFNGSNLIIEIENYADSETGSWNNPGKLEQCIDDPSYFAYYQLDCPTCDESGITVINPTCETVDQSGGVIIVTPEGIGPWNYLWFDLNTGEIIEQNNEVVNPVTVSGLPPSEYLIQVEDVGFPGGCSSPIYVDILPPQDIVVEFDINSTSCFDLNDGSITITSIMNSNCIDDILIAEDCCGIVDPITLEDLPDGVIDDADYSCPSTQASVCGCDNVTYFNSCQAENWYGITSYENGPCGSSPDYEVTWSSINSFDEEPNWSGFITNLATGEYTVSITNNNNTSPVFNCEYDTTITIYSPDEFFDSFTSTDIDCFLDDNNDNINDLQGSISIELNGGTPNYAVILYDDSGTEVLTTPSSISPILIENLSAGDYWFAALDDIGCGLLEQEVPFSILEPEELVINLDELSNFNGFNISCNGGDDGFINVSVSGGTPPYIYSWFDVDGNQINNTTTSISNLNAGLYSVNVTDFNDCSDNFEWEITEPLVPLSIIVSDIIVEDVTCFSSSDGAIELSIEGGVGDYTYEWTALNGGDVLGQENNQNLTNLLAGTYNVQISDENGCIELESFEVGGPNELTVVETLSFVSCQNGDDGSIDLLISGGTPPYSFDWSNGDITEDIENLSTGSYSVVISDSGTCFSEYEYEIIEPELLSASINVIDVLCFGENTGSINSIISGGTPPYIENLSNGADQNSLIAGVYDLTILDLQGCEFIIPNIQINQPDEPIELTNVDITLVSCIGENDGSISLDIIGGTPPYNTSWDGNNFTSSDISISNLLTGEYTINIIDDNGCVMVETFDVFEQNPISITENQSDYNGYGVTCSGATDGFIDITVEGGDPPYTFAWDGDNGFFEQTEDIQNLPPGFYSLNLFDANNCQSIFEVEISEPEELIFESIETTDIDCFNGNNGSIDLLISGGAPAYTYSWTASNDVVIPPGQVNLEDINELVAGEYSVLVEDQNNCQIEMSINIEQPSDELSVDLDIIPINCNGETGSINPIADGGTPPYEYSIQGDGDLNNLLAGTYIIIVEDSNGCVLEEEETLYEPLLLSIQTIFQGVSCYNFNDGQAEVIVSGGTPDPLTGEYTYSWTDSNGGIVPVGQANNQNLTNLVAGDYSVFIEDSNGCSLNEDVTINQAQESSMSIDFDNENFSCLDIVFAQVLSNDVISGVWSTSDPDNVVFSDSSSLQTDILISEYGVYDIVFTNSCEESVNSTIDMQALEPIVTGPDEVNCLDVFNLSAEVEGDPGGWSGEGPGNISFDSINLSNTSVTVDEYGEYIFTYGGCGANSSIIVNMNAVNSQLTASPQNVYCDFFTDLEAVSISGEGVWSLIDAPENTLVTFDNPNSLTPQIIVSNQSGEGDCCYGDYLFSFESCGKEQYLPVSFRKEAPEFGLSSYKDCYLSGAIFIYNPDQDAFSPGNWEAIGPNANNVTISNESPNGVEFSVSEYGGYQFNYVVCDTFYSHYVGFSCPLEIPNTFTPNGDSNNDYFLQNILIPGVHTQINFNVFNRFGQIVHSKNNFDNIGLWDGTINNLENKQINDGVYYYTLELFNLASQRKEFYSGYVQVFKGNHQM